MSPPMPRKNAKELARRNIWKRRGNTCGQGRWRLGLEDWGNKGLEGTGSQGGEQVSGVSRKLRERKGLRLLPVAKGDHGDTNRSPLCF